VASEASRTGRLLVVDDERALREMATEYLRSIGHEVEPVGSLEQARARLKTRSYDLVLADLVLGDEGTGIDLLREIRSGGNGPEVIIMTGQGGVDAAVEATRLGAYDFVTKPLSLPRLELDVRKALEKRALEQDLQRLTDRARGGFGELIGVSPAMQALFRQLERAASTDSNVLLLGESGTGKEVAAREIHRRSGRRAGPFVAVHCGAISSELIESELFGHRRGSFTGADQDREGVFVAASGGTLFLDEVGTAPAKVQVRLLRALQEREIRPVGSDRDLPVDVRVIAATNADLERAIEDGGFRADLYYRLATLVLRMPPLRDRREDIPALAQRFLNQISEREDKAPRLSPKALEQLLACPFKGNVRELQHVLEQAAVMGDGHVIRADDLPVDVPPEEAEIATLEEVERAHIQRVLSLCGGNKKRAARVLAIPRPTLYRKIERYGLEAPTAGASRPRVPHAAARPASGSRRPAT
jgi:DNA-binding NtrC family response regulator